MAQYAGDCGTCGAAVERRPWHKGTGRGGVFCNAVCRKSFRGRTHWNRREARWVDAYGYIWISVPEHESVEKHSVRLNRRRIHEHVYKAEKALGRKIRAGEVVHHVNCDPSDNRNENLLICSRSYHAWLHGEMSRRWAAEHLGRVSQ